MVVSWIALWGMIKVYWLDFIWKDRWFWTNFLKHAFILWYMNPHCDFDFGYTKPIFCMTVWLSMLHRLVKEKKKGLKGWNYGPALWPWPCSFKRFKIVTIIIPRNKQTRRVEKVMIFMWAITVTWTLNKSTFLLHMTLDSGNAPLCQVWLQQVDQFRR